jgi:hypothetical protein
MAYHTGNQAAVGKLQDALQAFLDDHRKSRTARTDEPGYVPPSDGQGCGCTDCNIAGELLGSIY